LVDHSHGVVGSLEIVGTLYCGLVNYGHVIELLGGINASEIIEGHFDLGEVKLGEAQHLLFFFIEGVQATYNWFSCCGDKFAGKGYGTKNISFFQVEEYAECVVGYVEEIALAIFVSKAFWDINGLDGESAVLEEEFSILNKMDSLVGQENLGIWSIINIVVKLLGGLDQVQGWLSAHRSIVGGKGRHCYKS
jgi:hypothetical protein